VQEAEQEIQIIEELDHPNIIKVVPSLSKIIEYYR
jgi:hypothetical protein